MGNARLWRYDLFGGQGLINIAMVCNILPVVGVPLPLSVMVAHPLSLIFCGSVATECSPSLC